MNEFDGAKFEYGERVIVSDKVNGFFGRTGTIGTRAKDTDRNMFMYVVRFNGNPEVRSGEDVFDEWQIEKV
jgi:hypothetical protein